VKDVEGVKHPVVYDWVRRKSRRKSIDAARTLLAEGRVRDGRDQKQASPGAGSIWIPFREGQATTPAWIGTGASLRSSTFSWRFVQRLESFPGKDPRRRNTQIFFLGWNADYPDPENFMFLLNGCSTRAPRPAARMRRTTRIQNTTGFSSA